MNLINPYRFAAAAGESASRDFNGTSDWVRIPDFSYSTTAMTAMCWVKSLDTGDTTAILGHYDVNAQASWIVTFSAAGTNGGKNLRVVVSDDGGGIDVRASYGTSGAGGESEISDGTWHHIAFTWSDPNTLNLFVDGVDVVAATIGGVADMHDSTADITLGSILNSGVDIAHYDGKLSDVRIYDEVVSGANIATIIAGGDYETNLAGRWITDVDDVLDYSTNSNHGLRWFNLRQ